MDVERLTGYFVSASVTELEKNASQWRELVTLRAGAKSLYSALDTVAASWL